ncbi:hypothetical protein B0H15DRAFT_993885 [Mycena belliarum]|uniref:Uncharacterized protein n=1 Tax=Mycena belliarum TaxID=1033014 RepID=A0AAD6TZ42_9AGAR|nr:hypothetical protein B0H15DRAFT_993885 [Mycena belliae]
MNIETPRGITKLPYAEWRAAWHTFKLPRARLQGQRRPVRTGGGCGTEARGSSGTEGLQGGDGVELARERGVRSKNKISRCEGLRAKGESRGDTGDSHSIKGAASREAKQDTRTREETGGAAGYRQKTDCRTPYLFRRISLQRAKRPSFGPSKRRREAKRRYYAPKTGGKIAALRARLSAVARRVSEPKQERSVVHGGAVQEYRASDRRSSLKSWGIEMLRASLNGVASECPRKEPREAYCASSEESRPAVSANDQRKRMRSQWGKDWAMVTKFERGRNGHETLRFGLEGRESRTAQVAPGVWEVELEVGALTLLFSTTNTTSAIRRATQRKACKIGGAYPASYCCADPDYRAPPHTKPTCIEQRSLNAARPTGAVPPSFPVCRTSALVGVHVGREISGGPRRGALGANVDFDCGSERPFPVPSSASLPGYASRGFLRVSRAVSLLREPLQLPTRLTNYIGARAPAGARGATRPRPPTRRAPSQFRARKFLARMRQGHELPPPKPFRLRRNQFELCAQTLSPRRLTLHPCVRPSFTYSLFLSHFSPGAVLQTQDALPSRLDLPLRPGESVGGIFSPFDLPVARADPRTCSPRYAHAPWRACTPRQTARACLTPILWVCHLRCVAASACCGVARHGTVSPRAEGAWGISAPPAPHAFSSRAIANIICGNLMTPSSHPTTRTRTLPDRWIVA